MNKAAFNFETSGVPPILIVDLSKHFGGGDVRVAQLASALPESIVAVIAGSETHRRFAQAGIRVWPILRGRKDPRILWDLVRYIRKIRPGVIDAHNVQSILWGLPAARIMGVPVRISTFHSVLEESEMRRFGRQLYDTLQLFADNFSTGIVAVTETVAEHLRCRGIPGERIKVIHNGIDAAPNTPRGRASAKPYRIAIVGRLVPVKAHNVALEALAILSASCPDAEYVIVGDGPEHANLLQQARNLGLTSRVHFLGYRDDVRSVLETCDLMCLPSLSEGLPFAALEAATLGIPLVASNVGGLALHFRDFETARLVVPGSAKSLSEALLWSYSDRVAADAIGARARQFVADRFSLDRMLMSTLAAYSAVDRKLSNMR